MITNVSTFNPVSLVLSGPGALKEAAPLLKRNGFKRPLLVTDQGVTNLPFCSELMSYLRAEALEPVVYDEVLPNPPDVQVHEGADLYKRENCDCLIALGGGSSIDCAKAIGVIVTNGGEVRDYTTQVNALVHNLPYFMAVPTTAGSGSECTAAAVLTNTKGQHYKMIIWDVKILPSVAIVDPVIMTNLPPGLTASTGLDALTHAIEAYLAIRANDYTDALALGAIKLIFKYLRRAVANGQDIEARERMACAQTMAGLAFNSAGLGLTHAMSHQLSALYDIPHGTANAILLPWVMDYNIIARLDKMIDIAVASGENGHGLSSRSAASLAPKAVRDLSQDLEMIGTITEAAAQRGFKEAKTTDIDILVDYAMNDVFRPFNPRKATPEAIKKIYLLAWEPKGSDCRLA